MTRKRSMLGQRLSALRRRSRLGTAATAAAALGFDLIIIWRGDTETWNGSHLPTGIVVVVAIVVYTLLLARRAHPLTVFASLWIFSLVSLVMPAVVPFAGPLLALHSVASRCAFRIAALCLAMCAAPVAVQAWAAATAHDSQLMDTWTSFIVQFCLLYSLVAAAWIAGRAAYAADQRQQERSQAAAAAALQAERIRIARELHDSVSHGVTAMLLQAAGARRSLKSADDPELAGVLGTIENLGTQAMGEMHHLLRLLRSSADDANNSGPYSQPGIGAIGQLVDNARAAGLVVQVRTHGRPKPMNPSVSLAAYRVVQEALTNVIKHADTSAGVQLLLHWQATSLVIEVHNRTRHNDHGSDPRLSSGFGILGLHERLRVIGGHLESSRDVDGFHIRAELPC
jgi:signal transduction histidine kinase